MSDDPIAADLARTKLQLEIDELSKPIYRKPALYAVLGPTLLAAGTLSLGFYTGLFNVQKESLRVETIKLTIDKTKLDGDIAGLEVERKQVASLLADERTRSEAAIAEAKSQAQQEIGKERERFESESRRLAAEFEIEKQSLRQELDPLRQQLAAVTGEIEAKNREMEQLRIESENRAVQTLLDQLRLDTFQGPQHPAAKDLIALLQKDAAKAPRVEARMRAEADPFFKATVRYVLYLGTRQPEQLEQLFAFAEQNAGVPHLWHIIGVGDWSPEDEIKAIRFLARSVEKLKLTNLQIGQAYIIFAYLTDASLAAVRNMPPAEKAALVRTGRALAFDRDMYPSHRVYGMRSVAFLVPEAYPVILNALLLDRRESEESVFELRRDARSARNDVPTIKAALDRLQYPQNLIDGPREWDKTAIAQKWKALVLGNDVNDLLKVQDAAR